MTTKIHADGLREQLMIDTNSGRATVSVDFGGSLKIEGKGILASTGLTEKDALALFFDLAAKPATKKRFANFIQGLSGNTPDIDQESNVRIIRKRTP